MNKRHPPTHAVALNKPKGKALLMNTHLYVRIHRKEKLSQAPKENGKLDIIEHFLCLHVNFTFCLYLDCHSQQLDFFLEAPERSCQGFIVTASGHDYVFNLVVRFFRLLFFQAAINIVQRLKNKMFIHQHQKNFFSTKCRQNILSCVSSLDKEQRTIV